MGFVGSTLPRSRSQARGCSPCRKARTSSEDVEDLVKAEQQDSQAARGSRRFQVCPVCHRWYEAQARPWWNDRCRQCDEVQHTRTYSRKPGPAQVAGHEDEVTTEA